ncbi:hypothetical protein, partial [Staphylococcus aureus]
ALRTGIEASASLPPLEIDEFESDLMNLAALVLNPEIASAPPAWKGLCRRCEFIPLCRRDPGFAVAESAAAQASAP